MDHLNIVKLETNSPGIEVRIDGPMEEELCHHQTAVNSEMGLYKKSSQPIVVSGESHVKTEMVPEVKIEEHSIEKDIKESKQFVESGTQDLYFSVTNVARLLHIDLLL